MLRSRYLGLVILLAAALAGTIALSALSAVHRPRGTAFEAENAAAMDKMMKGMHVPPSGDVDRDFAVMMIAHHQGAVDMALAQLRHGRDERLKRLATEIVIEQREEIQVMQDVLVENMAQPRLAVRP